MKLILQVLKGWIFSPHKLGSGLNDKNIYTYLEAKNIALEFFSIKYLIMEIPEGAFSIMFYVRIPTPALSTFILRSPFLSILER